METEIEKDNDLDVPDKERTVLEKILDWSENQNRPMWQRDALRRILQKNDIEKDIEELVICLKNEVSGQPNNASIPLTKVNLPASPDAEEAIRISKMNNILHVNNLATDQELTFGNEGITVIYGGNGSGKSGYTRILKNACRARHRDKILNNIYASEYELETPSANIYYNTNSKKNELVNWEDSNSPHRTLSAVYVFDRQCANVHLQKKGNEIAFSPYGLDIPDRLIDVCNRIEEKIKTEIGVLTRAQNNILSNPPWQTTTEAGKFASYITSDSKIEVLERLSDFTKENEERLNSLTETLSKDIQKAAQEEKVKADRLLRFRDDINAKIQMLSKAKLDAILVQRQVVIDTKQAAENAARLVMGEDILSGVGEQVWKVMWDSAREYSVKKAYIEKQFPNIEDGAKCVLCQQDLDAPAKERMKSFEEHVKGAIEQKAEQAKVSYNSLYRESFFSYIKFSNYRDTINDIGLISPELLKAVWRYLASIRLRQMQFCFIVNNSKDKNISEYSPSPFVIINQQIQKHQTFAQELKEAANDAGLATLKKEKMELEDKKFVKNHKQLILDEIKRLQDIDFLKECLKNTNTRSITTLSNKIADEVITPKIGECFQKEIKDLMGERVRVEFQRTGGKPGSPNHKLVLLSSPDTVLSTVLSEGEQTCVALAVFLAELATSLHKSALVFDDPVSSLDHDWRSKVARRLVEEAKTRQVIVFTHDLVFVDDIQTASNDSDVEFLSRYLDRIPTMVGIVYDNLPWDGMKIRATIDYLEKKVTKIRNERSKLTRERYNDEAAKFFDEMRNSWERALEEVGLSRVIVRYSAYIDVKRIKELSPLDINDFDFLYKSWSRCSDYVRGHNNPRARNHALPEPDELAQEVAKLKEWVNKIKENRKITNP